MSRWTINPAQMERAHARQSLLRRQNVILANSQRWKETAICSDCPGEFTRARKENAEKRCPLCRRTAKALASHNATLARQAKIARGLLPCRGCGASTAAGRTCQRCGDTNREVA